MDELILTVSVDNSGALIAVEYALLVNGNKVLEAGIGTVEVVMLIHYEGCVTLYALTAEL